MKIFVLFLLIPLFIIQQTKAQNYKLVSITHYVYGEAETAIPSEKIDYQRNGCRTLSTHSKKWDMKNGVWQNATSTQYYYNQKDQAAGQIIRNWDKGTKTWENHRQIVQDRDTEGKLMRFTHQSWMSDNQQWQNNSRDVYSYEVGKSWTEDLQQKWDKTSNNWILEGRSVRLFDHQGVLYQNIHYQYDETGKETKIRRFQNIQSENKTKSSNFYDSWDEESGSWTNNKKTTTTINEAGKTTLSETEKWDSKNNIWLPSHVFRRSYDKQEFETERIYERWDTKSHNWLSQDRHLYTRNNEGNVTTITKQRWDVTLDAWVNARYSVYTWDREGEQSDSATETPQSTEDFETIKPEEIAEKVECFFQNPHVIGSNINCLNLEEGTEYQLIVSDMLGRVAYRQDFGGTNNPMVIDRQFPTGLYILAITSQKGTVFARKIIIESTEP